MVAVNQIVEETVFRYRTEGVDDVRSKADALAKAQSGVAKSSDTAAASNDKVEKSARGTADAYGRAGASATDAAQKQAVLERAQRQIQASMMQAAAGADAYDRSLAGMADAQMRVAQATAQASAQTVKAANDNATAVEKTNSIYGEAIKLALSHPILTAQGAALAARSLSGLAATASTSLGTASAATARFAAESTEAGSKSQAASLLTAQALSLAAQAAAGAGTKLGGFSQDAERAVVALTPFGGILGIVSRGLTALSGAAPLIGAAALGFTAFVAVPAILGKAYDDLAKLVELGERAEKLDVGATFLKSFTELGPAIRVSADEMQAALQRASSFVQERLGQQNQLAKAFADLNAGGYTGGAPLAAAKQLETARNAEDRIRAALAGMAELETREQRLAALDLSEKVFGPAVTERLRVGQTTVAAMIADLDKAGQKQLFTDLDATRALALSRAIQDTKRGIDDALASTFNFSSAARTLDGYWLSILKTVLAVAEAGNRAVDAVSKGKPDEFQALAAQIEAKRQELARLEASNASVGYEGDDIKTGASREELAKLQAAFEALTRSKASFVDARIDAAVGDIAPPARLVSDELARLTAEADNATRTLPGVAGALQGVGGAASAAAAQIASVAAGIRAIQGLNPDLSGVLGFVDKVKQVNDAFTRTKELAQKDFDTTGDGEAAAKRLNEALAERAKTLKAISDQQGKGATDYVRSGELAQMSDVDRSIAQLGDNYSRVRKERETFYEGLAKQAVSPDDAAAIRRQGEAEIAKLDTARKSLEAKTRADAAARGASKGAETPAGADAYDNAIQRTRDQIQEFELQTKAAGKASEEVYKLTEANRLRRAAASAGRADEAGIADAIDAQAAAYARARKASEDAIEAQRRLQEGQREIASDFGRFAEDILLGGAKMSEAFASLAKTVSSGTLRALLTGEGPLAGLLGTVPKEKGDVGGLLGGQINLGSLFKVDDIAKTLGLGAETGIGNALSAALKPAKAGGGFLSSPLGGGLAAGAAGASVGYSSASPLMGAGTGIIAGLATGNPVAAVAGGVLGFIGGLFGESAEKKAAKKKIQDQLKAYAEEYANMLPQIAVLRAGLRGEATTGTAQTIEATRGQAVQAIQAASKGGQQGQADDILNEFFVYKKRVEQQFVETFEGTLAEVAKGLGASGPFNQAAVQVRQLGESLLAFVDDTKAIAGAEATSRARTAAINAALNSLDAPKTLSATATEFARIQGTAAGLQTVLVQLGASAEDAAKAISTRTAAALDALRDKFNDDVGRKLNDAQDRGYLNDAADLIKEVKTLREDAATVGGDLGQVQSYFTAAAQKIVNGSELTGTAFDDLMKRFPDLTGLVHAYDAALVDTTKSAADAAAAEETLAARRLGYQDRAFAATNDSSTLSGSLAAFDRKAAQDRAAEVKAGGQAINDLETALAAERLGIIQDFATKAAEAAQAAADAIAGRVRGYADRLFAATNDTSTLDGQLAAYDRQAQQEREDEVKAGGEAIAELEAAQFAERLKIVVDYQTQAAAAEKQRMDAAQTAFDTFARNIKTFVDGLRAGSSSPLSPQARLAAAQTQYNAQLTAAQGGDRTALDGITSYASDLLDAAKGFYASSAAFQTVFQQVTGQLTALPTQVSPEQFIVNAITDSKAATVAATQAMQAVLKSAIDAGSGSATAAALLPQFSNLTATTGGLLNYSQFVQATGGLATVSEQQAARTIFNSLDADSDGQLSKLELIRGESHDTNVIGNVSLGKTDVGNTQLYNIAVGTGTTNGKVDASNNLLGSINGQTSGTKGSVDAGNSQLVSIVGKTDATQFYVNQSNGILNAINGLSNTQIAQLAALNNQFAFSPFNAPNGVRLDNNLVTALNKIVFNTANTVIGQKAGAAYVFASGGLVSGPGTGTSDSISARLSNGEFVMTAEATRRLGVDRLNALNDNLMSAMPSVAMPVPVAMPMSGGTDSASAAEIRALRAELKAALDTLARVTVAGAEHVGERVDGVKDAVDEGRRRSDLLAA